MASAPFFWWGPSLDRRCPASLAWLVGEGMLGVPAAAMLGALAARRLSLAVVAEPAGAGKTTLLTASLAHLPAEADLVFIRGGFESFAVLDESSRDPSAGVLLVNEISPHHPVYLWGANLARALAYARRGFALYATAHAPDADAFVKLFPRPPLSLPPSAAGAFDAVAAIGVSRDGRQVTGIWALVPGIDGNVTSVLVCDGASAFGELEAGLGEAAARGWLRDRAPLDHATLVATADRLDAVLDLRPAPVRPGEMLAREERRRSRRGAGSP